MITITVLFHLDQLMKILLLTQLKAEAFNKFFLEASVIDESSSTLPNTQQIIVDHPTLDNIVIT